MLKSLPCSLAIIMVVFSFAPSFAQSLSPKDIAIQHMENSRKNLHLTTEDISNYRISDLYKSKHNGITHVYFNQQHRNIDVRNAIININILPDGQVLNMGNRFVPNLASKVNTTTPAISAEEALQAVFGHLRMTDGAYVKVKEKRSNQHYVFENKGMALEPIPVKLNYELGEDGSVKLVWNIELFEMDAQNW